MDVDLKVVVEELTRGEFRATLSGGRWGAHRLEGNIARIVAHARGYWASNSRPEAEAEAAVGEAVEAVKALQVREERTWSR